ILWQTTLDESTEPKQKFSGQKVITVIDSRQTRLQKIITSLIRKLSNTDNSYLHLSYESVTLSPDTAKTLGLNTGGKQAQMSGRKGLYVNADSVYSLLKSKTIKETQRRHPELSESEIETIAHQVTVGTLRYEMIKQDLDKIISFDLTKSLSLEGDTASYIQYAHARATRILEKSEKLVTIDVNFGLLSDLHEKELIKMIGLFDIQVIDAAKNLSPKVISRYCHDLAVAFNSFYEHVKVLGLDDNTLEDARLCLVNSFKNTIEKSLDILGISAPSKM
ncbi:MAG: arginine--tRNA ligase, partial [Nitrosarchaeum sp.]|nr:arginine--tRNA ligase [Nitrosarchaeum sp.]